MEVILSNGVSSGAHQLPLAPGTPANCFRYRDQFASRESLGYPSYVPYSEHYNVINDCGWLAGEYYVDFDDIVNWNPSLNRDKHKCELQPGFAYCMVKTEPAEGWAPLNSKFCFQAWWFKPGEIMEGTDADCNCFEWVRGSEIKDNFLSTCSKLLEGADVPLDNLFKLNTWIDKADCDGSLYAGMAKNENEIRAVCLGKRPVKLKPTVIVDKTPTQEPTPTCTPTFDPKVGEYVCPDPPICHFDPEKGEYICPEPTTTSKPKSKEEAEDEEREELRL